MSRNFGIQKSAIKPPPPVETPALLKDPVAAIMFAQTIDDHFDMREFLHAWTIGDVAELAEEWPEFTGDRDDKAKDPRL